ncbi:MAG TPA: aminotransferase class I/II-fold pyridoxal phosphate-dependent enzyme, partial [Candidatus Elarobacter sp.]|nr:aminotransferase class I/II-fold pyridoxal phosphate-dependent enzyme [Candidatus Elarobacter sp.]
RIPKVLRCTINGVNSVTQWAALAAITGDQAQLRAMCDEYEVRRDIMARALGGIPGVQAFVPRGGFFIWAELDPALYHALGVTNADELSGLLAEHGIGSAPGDAFGRTCDDAIRFSFSCATSMVKEGAVVLRDVLLGQAAKAA